LKLLDTSVIIGLLRGEEEIEDLLTQEEETLCTCFPVQCELYRGTRLARKTEEGETQVEALLDELEHLEAGKESAKKLNELRDKYPETKTFDLMIAGICLANNVPIITKDKDFEKIKELEVLKP
jgi:predicted nucleic acid-binding protein